VEPAGERELRALARRFADAERRVRGLLARAPEEDRRELLREALLVLAQLRRLQPERAVETAYLAAFARGDVRRVRDLAGSLSSKLDKAAQTAHGQARFAFRDVTPDNVEEMSHQAVTGYVDDAGRRQTLAPYAAMLTATIGRQATTRGVRDSRPTVVTITGGSCDVCADYQGEWQVAELEAWPPYHPSCDCIATPS
jgi:hypothetical protein